MRRALRTITAVLLLTLWLPATAHCSLGMAVDALASFCSEACGHDAEPAYADACASVETGDYRALPPVTHASAPHLSEIACLARLHARLLAEAAPLAPPSWVKVHPLDWIPAWSFTLRTALPARAPNLI